MIKLHQKVYPFFFLFLSLGGCSVLHRPAEPAALQVIAFTSCINAERPQKLWPQVFATHPEVFLFLGDNVYADTTSAAAMRDAYAKLTQGEEFRRLKTFSTVLAVWDDHDYGANDAGAEYPFKEQSKTIFLDAFEEPQESERRLRSGNYDALIYGPPGRRVQFLLLDTRSFRGPLIPDANSRSKAGQYLPHEKDEPSFLGEEQWVWLEQQLIKPAELRIIVSSVQVLADQHRFESWGNFPAERERLFALMRQHSAGIYLILSGDRHQAELSQRDDVLPYPLIDFTSSSFNLPRQNRQPEANRYRQGQRVLEENFGVIYLDWGKHQLALTLEIATLAAKQRHRIAYSPLIAQQ